MTVSRWSMVLMLVALLGLGAIPPAAAAPNAPQVADVYLPLIERSGIQPPVLKWQRGGCFNSWCETGWYASPAVADLDGDGAAEVIAAAYDLVILDGATGAL